MSRIPLLIGMVLVVVSFVAGRMSVPAPAPVSTKVIVEDELVTTDEIAGRLEDAAVPATRTLRPVAEASALPCEPSWSRPLASAPDSSQTVSDTRGATGDTDRSASRVEYVLLYRDPFTKRTSARYENPLFGRPRFEIDYYDPVLGLDVTDRIDVPRDRRHVALSAGVFARHTPKDIWEVVQPTPSSPEVPTVPAQPRVLANSGGADGWEPAASAEGGAAVGVYVSALYLSDSWHVDLGPNLLLWPRFAPGGQIKVGKTLFFR